MIFRRQPLRPQRLQWNETTYVKLSVMGPGTWRGLSRCLFSSRRPSEVRGTSVVPGLSVGVCILKNLLLHLHSSFTPIQQKPCGSSAKARTLLWVRGIKDFCRFCKCSPFCPTWINPKCTSLKDRVSPKGRRAVFPKLCSKAKQASTRY